VTTMRKRMGRPPLAKKERKEAHLSVRFTAEEYRGIERAAKVSGVAISEWARDTILSAAAGAVAAVAP
jgi:uncharacterized protein (DUF1778 family)